MSQLNGAFFQFFGSEMKLNCPSKGKKIDIHVKQDFLFHCKFQANFHVMFCSRCIYLLCVFLGYGIDGPISTSSDAKEDSVGGSNCHALV